MDSENIVPLAAWSNDPMRHWMNERLDSLRAEYQKGQQRLRELRAQETDIEQTMLRIEGAISVLTEALASGVHETKMA